jgi:hypothetical protein
VLGRAAAGELFVRPPEGYGVALSHKAFAFNWRAFEFDLHPQLEAALEADDPSELEAFIVAHRKSLTDPYEGEPLPRTWRSMLENRDAHEYGEFALTRFYDPTDDCGLHESWAEVSERLPKRAANALLGFPVGPKGRLFDPGRLGSYFQTPGQVRESLAILRPRAEKVEELRLFVELLERCAAEGLGVYVTF